MLQIVSFVCIYLDREERMCCLSRVNILSSLVRTRVVIRHLALVNIEWCRAHDIDVSYLSHFSSSFAPPVISSINITHLSNSSPHISSHVIVDKRGVAHFFHRILINKRNLYQLRESDSLDDECERHSSFCSSDDGKSIAGVRKRINPTWCYLHSF